LAQNKLASEIYLSVKLCVPGGQIGAWQSTLLIFFSRTTGLNKNKVIDWCLNATLAIFQLFLGMIVPLVCKLNQVLIGVLFQ